MTEHLVDVAGGGDGEEEDNDMVVCTDQLHLKLSVVPIMMSRQTDFHLIRFTSALDLLLTGRWWSPTLSS